MSKSQILTHSHNSIYACLQTDQHQNHRKSLPSCITSSATIFSSPLCNSYIQPYKNTKHLAHRSENVEIFNNSFNKKFMNTINEKDNINYSKKKVNNTKHLQLANISQNFSKSSFFNLNNVMTESFFKCKTSEIKKYDSVVTDKKTKSKSVNFSPQISFSQENKHPYRCQSQEQIDSIQAIFKGKHFSSYEILKCVSFFLFEYWSE